MSARMVDGTSAGSGRSRPGVVVAKKTISRTGIDAWLVSTARASSPMQAVRARSAATISQRRSARSATVPLGSANGSHGRVRATPTAPICAGPR
jgi:hypothetical protein